jgi:hypothetical protein
MILVALRKIPMVKEHKKEFKGFVSKIYSPYLDLSAVKF